GFTGAAVYDRCCPNWPETEGRVLLPVGEGGAKRRMRVYILAILRPSPGASRHPLPEGEGPLRNRSAYAWPFRSPRWHWIYAGHNFVIWTDVVYDRRSSRRVKKCKAFFFGLHSNVSFQSGSLRISPGCPSSTAPARRPNTPSPSRMPAGPVHRPAA